MPGLITHLLCSNQVSGIVDQELKEVIKKYPASYYLGSQGPDIFFYYLPGFFSKETLNLGLLLHKHNTQDYIIAMLDNAKKFEGEKRDIAVSYIAGYLSHYGLDSKTHPYIYYKTGFKQKGNFIKSIRHSLYHRKLETSIDTLLLKNLTNTKPSDKSLWEFFELEDSEEFVISSIISKSLNYAYGRYVSQKKTASILKYILLTSKYFQSPEGKQKKILEFLEDISIGEEVCAKLSNDQGNIDFLNLNKESWHTPWDNEIKNHDTFIELYNAGINESVHYINSAYLYMNDAVSEKYLRKNIKNLSMASGKDCNDELDWKHFKIIFKEQNI